MTFGNTKTTFEWVVDKLIGNKVHLVPKSLKSSTSPIVVTPAILLNQKSWQKSKVTSEPKHESTPKPQPDTKSKFIVVKTSGKEKKIYADKRFEKWVDKYRVLQ